MKYKQEGLFENLVNVGPLYGLIFVLFIVPLLIPYGYYPVSKFSSEVLTGVIGVIIGLFSILKAKKIQISAVAIAILLFGLFLLLQPILVSIRTPGINMAIACWFWAALMMSIGVTSFIDGDNRKYKQVVTVTCWAIFISAFIQAFFGLLQYTGVAANFSGLMLYIDTQSINVFGNIGQKNDYVDFLSMGIFALSYLYFGRKIKLGTFIVCEFFFLVIVSITTSRTSFVYFILALIMTLLFVFSRRRNLENKVNNRRVLAIVFGLLIGLLVVESLLPIFLKLFTSKVDATSAVYRFASSEIRQSTYRRFYEWYKCIIIFINHPLFGIGWYQYPKEAIDLMLKDPRFWYIPANSALYTHSHNSLVNIMAETGIVGTLIIVIYGFFYTLYNMFRKFNDFPTLFIAFIILTIFGQSMFQYPLWYGYFFMYFMFLLSINKATISFNNSKLFKGVFSVICVLFVYLCGVNYQTYIRLANFSMQPPKTIDDYTSTMRGLQQIVEHNPLWAFPALTVIDNYLQPGSPQTNAVFSQAEQVKYIDMLANQLPYPGIIFKQIIIHKMAGDNEGAIYCANLLAHGFPFFKDKFAEQLEQSSPLFVEEVKVMKSFKYEDRSIFTKRLSKDGKNREG